MSSIFSVQLLLCPAYSVFQYLQCSCISNVPVSPMFLYLQCSCISSVPVSPVFLYLQCSCIFRVPVSSEFQSLQRRIEVGLTAALFLWWKIACTSPDFGYFRAVLLEEVTTSWDAHWVGVLWIPRGLTPARYLSLGPKAEQDRQEPSNWSLVNVRLQFMTQCLLYPRHCGLSGRGSFTFVQRDVAPLPLGQLFCMSVTKLTWPPLLWSSQEVDFTNHFLLQKEDLEDPLLPLSFAEYLFKKFFCVSSSGRQGCLVYHKALQPQGIPKGPRQSRIGRGHPIGV